jgi:membrane glycosyltransferase
LELQRVRAAKDWLGAPRAILAVAVETVFSMLIAPILMMTQTAAVVQILMGRDAGWNPQQRGDSGIPMREALRFHWRHMAIGVGLALLCWNTTPELAIWMAPVILGLMLSAVMNWYTSRRANPFMGWLLSTPTDRFPAPILARADTKAEAWMLRAKTQAHH